MSYKKEFKKRLSAKELQPIEKIFNESIIPVVNAFINDRKQLESEGIDPSELEGYTELYNQYVGPYRDARAKYEELKNNGVRYVRTFNIDESNLESYAEAMRALAKEMNKVMGYEDE